MTEVTNERWAEHSTIMSLKGELLKAQAESRTLRNAALDLLTRAEAAEKDAAALRVVMERIAKESMDYQYVAQAALEAKP